MGKAVAAAVSDTWGNNATLTTTNGCYTWPANTLYYQPYPCPPPPQTLCTADTHIFPCQRCAICQCGQATVKRPKGKA